MSLFLGHTSLLDITRTIFCRNSKSSMVTCYSEHSLNYFQTCTHGHTIKVSVYHAFWDLTLRFYLQDIGSVRRLHARQAEGLVDTLDNY